MSKEEKAFPMYGVSSAVQEGMTMLDYFAAGFAQQIHAQTTLAITNPETGRHVFTQPAAQTAEQAYDLAAAMMKERAKRND